MSGAIIKTPGQMLKLAAAAFIIPIAVIIGLVTYASESPRELPTPEQTAMLIKPIGTVYMEGDTILGEDTASDQPKVVLVKMAKTGEQVFNNVCSGCHLAGAAGAPVFKNTQAWAPRIAKGYDALYTSVLKGKGVMAARGGASPSDVSDYELARALVYITNAAGAKFTEPKETK